MSLKKKLSILGTAICAITAVVLCVLLYLEWSSPDIIEPPLEKLEWGMTLEEAYEVLDEVGIEKVMRAGTDNFRRECELWTLTAEQAELLGYTHPGNLSLSNNEYWPVYVGFANSNSGGVIRLVSVAAMVEVPASESVTSLAKKEYAHSTFTKVYGASMNFSDTTWRIGTKEQIAAYTVPQLQAVSSGRTGPQELLLAYNGAGYVTSLYGGQFSSVFGDFDPDI